MDYLTKKSKIKDLAIHRKKDRMIGFPEGYVQVPEHFSYVSPITEKADNFDSPIMFIMQDWRSKESGKKSPKIVSEFGYDPKRKTNKVFDNYLKQCFKLKRKDVYITNAFVFVKTGDISASIKGGVNTKEYCIKEYTLKEIEIIKPRLVVCLGKYAYTEITKVLNREKYVQESKKRFRERVNKPFFYKDICITAICHPATGESCAGSKMAYEKQWTDLFKQFRSLSQIKN